MKLYVLFLSVVLGLVSCAGNENLQSPDEILSKASEKLTTWETISFTATTNNPTRPTTKTVYKLKKVNYEPHLKLFFFKEMNQETAIYYKLASLAVVEDKKNKITVFDYGKDRSIPRYLEAYMGDDDNLLVTARLMNQFKDNIDYVEQTSFNDRESYVYTFDKYKIWIDAKLATPLKLEIANGKSAKKEIIYDALVFNEPMDDAVFTHIEKEGYVSSVFGIKKEPMLNVKAPDWNLLDLDGKKVSLGDFRGSPIFLEAWTSSCNHCMASLPKVKEIESEFGDKVKVITVNFDYDLSETKKTAKTEGLNYMILQGDASFDKHYDLRSFPSYFVINSEGTIVYSERGTIEGKKAKALFEALRRVK
ncbi:TlpA disulfide reductase family protein [Gelidibacter maritimus]|uniref:TlpA family protein disulfide reductase n=1 Tax=Gelidibacter maritimus TaxID=2761487 RepID=A0A7W2M3M1_9FLAO|nr:TlpA disulfide reductase family protein [Gelidibacter maritimus]MBA6152077.1 TlpA family protein disulfide reductase [Gelidibacter maritimus]